MRRRGMTIAAVATVAAVAAIAGPWRAAPGVAQTLDVAVPPLSGEAAAGATPYTRYCAKCHGAVGDGSNQGPPLIHRIYAPGHHADGAFLLAALRGSRQHHWNFGDMPPVEGITEEAVAKIVAFVRTVQRANGVE